MKPEYIVFDIPPNRLTLNDQIELGRRMVEYGDKKAREALVLNCVPMVKTIVNHYRQKYSFDDLFQDGMLGVLDAIDKYDYKRNVQFRTFAYPHVVKRVLKGIRNQLPTHVTSEDQERSFLIKSTIKSFFSTFERNPTNEEISTITSIPLKNVIYLREHNIQKRFMNYDDFEYEASLTNTDFTQKVEQLLCNESNKELVMLAMAGLTDSEKDIINRRYLNPVRTTLKELSAEQQTPIPTIQKREKKILKKMLRYFITNRIKIEDLVD